MYEAVSSVQSPGAFSEMVRVCDYGLGVNPTLLFFWSIHLSKPQFTRLHRKEE